MTFDVDFKKALQLLPDNEKDKLILRLLKRDLGLAEKLRFELVDTDSVQDKRDQLRERMIASIKRISERYYSPGYLLMDMRELSGDINAHVSMTKDKFGEIELNCLMISEILKRNGEKILSESPSKAYTFLIYVVARVFKILILIQKQHEDLHLEFNDAVVSIGELIGNNPALMKMAIRNGLDVNWLTRFEIPNNIADIYKNLRENGLLK